MTAAILASALNVSLLLCGLPEVDCSAFGPLTGCEAASAAFPGLSAQELRPGEGPPIVLGDRATIWVRAAKPGGTVAVDSERRGLPMTVTLQPGTIWEALLHGMAKGEKRRVELDYRASFGSYVGMTFEIRLEAIARVPLSAARQAQR